MHATRSRGRRTLAILTTTTALLLPAAGASAAPAEQANERATAAQEPDEDRGGGRPSDDRGASRTGGEDEVTEDSDRGADNDEDVPNTPDVNGDADDQHPSGKDRSDEPGGSGNQGDAQHDPDDDGNGPDRGTGGVDQPGGAGGVDQDDQDGNNGCGNDDDFEDDNEGLCLGPDRGDEETAASTDVDDDDTDDDTDDETVGTDADGAGEVEASATTGTFVPEQGVLSDTVVVRQQPIRAPAADVSAAGFEVETAVLSATSTAAGDGEALGAVTAVEQAVAADGTLPRSGAGLAGLAVLGLSALGGGAALSRRRD